MSNSDEPEQEEVTSDDLWLSRPLAQRAKSAPKEPALASKTPEDLVAEQSAIQSFLEASEKAGVKPEVLADRLMRAVEHLQHDEDDLPPAS